MNIEIKSGRGEQATWQNIQGVYLTADEKKNAGIGASTTTEPELMAKQKAYNEISNKLFLGAYQGGSFKITNESPNAFRREEDDNGIFWKQVKYGENNELTLNTSVPFDLFKKSEKEQAEYLKNTLKKGLLDEYLKSDEIFGNQSGIIKK